MNKHKILYKLIAMFTIVILLNVININTTKAITMNAYPMTDSNFNIWGESVQTTFSDKGYFSVLDVNGTETNIKNCSGSLNGVSVETKLSYISNGNYVKISFEATNTSGSAKTIGIATYADIQIADNDYAPITNLSGNRGFTMTDGTKYTFTFLGRNSYGVTDVDTYWFGQFQIREKNKWNNSQTFDYGSESDRKGDSGMAFSWKNRTIQNGEKLIFSVAIGIGTLNTPPTIRATSQLKNSYIQGEKVDVEGYVNDVDKGDIVTVKYAIDNGSEITISNNLTPNGTEKYFHATFTIPNSITNGQHFFQIWAADDCGNMSVPVTVYFTVNKDETAPTGSHSTNPSDWTNGNVTITVTATDNVSGVKRIKKPDGNYVSSASATYTVTANGTYTFVLEDNVGNTRNYNVTISNIDKVAPTGSLSHSPTNWVNTDVKIHWTAADANSGFKQIKLPDGTIKTTATGDYTVSQNGTYTFVVYDVAGNTLTLQEKVTNIDKVAPTGSLSHSPTNWVNTDVKIHWSVADANSGFKQIKLPDGTIKTTATGDYTVSQNGTYTFVVYDVAGNTLTLQEKVTNIDKTAPTGSLSHSPTNWVNTDVKIHWTAADANSGFKQIKLPDGTIKTTATGDYTVSQNGTYTFVVYDVAGNTLTLKETVSNIDKTAPTGSLSHSPTNWVNTDVKIHWTAADANSGFKQIKLPDGTIKTTATGDYTVSQNGTYTFVVYDVAGNTLTLQETVTNIDKVAPTGSLSHSPTNWVNTDLKIHWTAADANSGFKQIKLPDGTIKTTATGDYTVSQNGTYTFVIYDVAGNTLTLQETVSNIDKTPPTGSLNHTPTDWVIDYVKIHWTASDSQSGFNRVVLPDGTSTTNASGDFTVTDNGTYTFTLYDNVGNSRILTEDINNIDKIMPEGVLSLQENRLTDEKIKISWKAFDLQSGFSKILLPDSTFSTNATGEFTVAQMGDYSFVIYDKVGNTRELSINVSNVDMINPILEVTQDTDKWTNGEITLNWKADDYQSGLQNVILPSSENVTDKQGSYIVTENGNYIFLAYDKIGNGILVEHQVTNIDKINPNLDLTVDSADDGGIQISWVSSDEQSGISNITLPDGKRVANSSGSIEIYENGVYSFIAYDNAGNATVKDVTIDSINNGSEIKLVLYKEAIDSTHWRIKWQITEGKDKFAYIVLPNGTFSYEPEGSHIVTGGNAEYTFLAYDKKGNENIGTIAVSY